MTTGLLTTTAGRAAIVADLGGGADLVLTHVAWGDANGVPYNPNEAQVALVREKYRAAIASVAVVDGAIVVDAIIPADTPDGSARPSHGFNVAEVGLFSAAGTLIGLARCGNGYKPPPSSGQASAVTYRLKLAVANPSAITVTIDPTAQVNIGRQVRPFWVTVDGVLNDPPAAPAIGATYIINGAPTGAWVGQAYKLAQWVGVWVVTAVPTGHMVSDNSAAENSANRYLKRTAAGWSSAAAATDAYGFARLATPAEAKARTATDSALTPAGLDQATSGLAEKQPIYPEITTAGNVLAFTTAVGQVSINDGAEWVHRGLVKYTTVEFAAGARTFATVASKTYHLVWDAPGTGLATPLATYPRGRFSLIDRTGASPAEGDPSYDTTFDRMLCAWVGTSAGNVVTVTPLLNRAALVATLVKSTRQRGASWSALVSSGYQINSTINWARSPQLSLRNFDVDAETDTEGLNGVLTASTRYAVTAFAQGYMVNSGAWSPNIYVSGAISIELRA